MLLFFKLLEGSDFKHVKVETFKKNNLLLEIIICNHYKDNKPFLGFFFYFLNPVFPQSHLFPYILLTHVHTFKTHLILPQSPLWQVLAHYFFCVLKVYVFYSPGSAKAMISEVLA